MVKAKSQSRSVTDDAPEASDGKNYFSPRQLADRYQVSPRHLRDLIIAGKFPSPIQVGAARRWSLATLLNWEQQGGAK